MNRHLRYLGAVGAVGVVYWIAAKALQLAIDELRELARGIHPAVLSDRGLGPALEVLVDHTHFPVALSRGTGLRGLADRIEALGGKLELDSPPGQGTVLTASIPFGG